MDKNTEKGLIPGKTAALYTVLIVAAVFYGLSFLQDIAVLVSIDSIKINHIYYGGVFGAISCDLLAVVFRAPDAWKTALVLLFEAIACVLPVLAAKGIYGRRKRGYYLASASAAACAAVIVFTIIAIESPKLLNIAPHAAICVAILLPAQGYKEYLLYGEELGRNE